MAGVSYEGHIARRETRRYCLVSMQKGVVVTGIRTPVGETTGTGWASVLATVTVVDVGAGTSLTFVGRTSRKPMAHSVSPHQ